MIVDTPTPPFTPLLLVMKLIEIKLFYHRAGLAGSSLSFGFHGFYQVAYSKGTDSCRCFTFIIAFIIILAHFFHLFGELTFFLLLCDIILFI